MKTCKDCLHSKVCRDWWSEQEKNLFSESNIACRVFTDRSEWVHLPCKVGAKFYQIRNNTCACYDCDGYNVFSEWCEYKNIDCPLIAKSPVCSRHYLEVVTGDAVKDFILHHINDIGKTVFFTHEEAEQALKERESK